MSTYGRGFAAALLTTTLITSGSAHVATAKPADTLTVSAGQVGALTMGTSTKSAKRRGWISRDSVCGSWTAGPKALKRDSDGREVFKAFPDKIENGRVLSMWAIGEVQTTRGIKTRSLGDPSQPGSPLRAIRSAYPDLQKKGTLTDISGLRNTVYTTGGPRKGWLDFHVRTSTNRLNYVVVRTSAVDWRFEGADGC